MIVYVESNFVLELVFENETVEACEWILSHCERGGAVLHIPAFAVVEPNETIQRRVAQLSDVQRDFSNAVRQLERSERWSAQTKGTRELLVAAVAVMKGRWDSVRARLLRSANLIPLDNEVLREAERAVAEHSFRLPDAVVFASVAVAARKSGEASLFVTRDDAFLDPGVVSALAASNCKLLRDFRRARALLENSVT